MKHTPHVTTHRHADDPQYQHRLALLSVFFLLTAASSCAFELRFDVRLLVCLCLASLCFLLLAGFCVVLLAPCCFLCVCVCVCVLPLQKGEALAILAQDLSIVTTNRPSPF